MSVNNYRDYVIKDGELIGKFEEMYQSCPDPWNQDTDVFIYKLLSLKLLKLLGHCNFRSILDIGCGKGKFTSFIKKSYPEAKVHGLDISATAVKTAGQRYPDINFQTFDITRTPFDYSGYDCIFMTEVIWYVLPRLEDVFSQIYRDLQLSKGIFVLNNHLYQNSEQKYGREYVTTLQSLLKKIPFKLEYLLENNRLKNYDLTVICRADQGK